MHFKSIFYDDSCPNNVKKLFIMESFSKQEIENKWPCMGKTGKIMSQRLFGCTTPFGQIMQTKSHPDINHFAVMESFDFPLITEDWGQEQIPDEILKWCKLKMIEKKWEEHHCRNTQYSNLRSHISTIHDDIFSTYVKRVEKTLMTFSNLQQVVVCGFIAQSMFLEAFNFSHQTIKYKQKNEWRKYDLRFVNHPAHVDQFNHWDY